MRTRCLDCGTELVGPYCHTCGQEVREPEPPAGSLIREMVADAVGADAATWRSLRLLLLRPGALTEEYLSGRRQRHLSPIRVYLLASALFVTLAVLTPADSSMIRVDPPAELADRADAFRETVLDIWPWFLVLMLPAFAAVHAIVLMGVRATFTRALVFTLHVHAFGFLALSVALLVAYLPPAELGAGLALLFVVSPVPYLVIALRRAYRISRGASVAAVFALCIANTLLAGLSAYLAYEVAVRLA